MFKPEISLQTYTIRKFLKTPAGRDEAFAKIKSMGINAVELARVKFTPGVISQISSLCSNRGIKVLSTQMKLREIEADPEWTVKLHRQLGCTVCAVSVIDLSALRSAAGLKIYAQRLNILGGRLKQEGIRLLFHHHNFEFVPLEGSDGFNILSGCLNPDNVGFVLDTYWLQRSGHSPAAFIRSLKGRVGGIHLRDFSLRPPMSFPRITDTELGCGNIDFQAVYQAACDVGCGYMAIEQTSPDPWRSIGQSIAHIKKIGLGDHLQGDQ